MGLFSRSKLKIKVETAKKDNFSGWIQCSGCSEMVHANELHHNVNCCPKCGYHYRLSVKQRIELLADAGTFEEKFQEVQSTDPLGFVDSEKYTDRLEEAREKSGRDEAVIVGSCTLDHHRIALGVLDFSFMGGSMGSVVGERITRLIELAVKNKWPLVLVSSSGGARMQESILSLMQMAKTSAALTKLHEARLPFISIFANPTTGGVTASFASLGDILIAEPEALIAFAGPRVVEQTIGQKLPSGAQRAEFLLERGMLDCIVPRRELKKRVSFFLSFLTCNERTFAPDWKNEYLLDEKMPERLKELLKVASGEALAKKN